MKIDRDAALEAVSRLKKKYSNFAVAGKPQPFSSAREFNVFLASHYDEVIHELAKIKAS